MSCKHLNLVDGYCEDCLTQVVEMPPVSPNTNIDELLTRDGITELVDYPGGKVIRIKPSVIQEARALLSAAKIEELKLLDQHGITVMDNNGEINWVEERIKRLEKQ